jgi:hypothetical protein
MSAATVIILRRKRIINAFRMGGATDREHAVSLESLGIRRAWIFNQMLRHGAFQETDNHQYFMNDAVAREFMRVRRIRALVLAGIFVIIFLIFWLTGVFIKQ